MEISIDDAGSLHLFGPDFQTERHLARPGPAWFAADMQPLPPSTSPTLAFLIQLAAMAGFALLMAVCAQLAVPMVPVPMTMQTWAVLLAGVALGPVRGAAAVLLYLAAAWTGLPVLSDGGSGAGPFTGPTAGYLLGFVLAAGMAGGLSSRGRLRRALPAVAWMIGLHGLILALGAAWLAHSIGPGPALENGLLPFLPGAVLKSVLIIAAARGLARLGLAPDRFRRA